MAEDFRGDSLIMPHLVKLHDCLCTELERSGLKTKCDCFLLHGMGQEPALPQAGHGIAWVGLTSIFPSKIFPNAEISIENCPSPIAALAVVGVVRCYTVRTQGETVADMTAYMDKQMADMAAMRRAILCCLSDDETAISLGTYSPIGPTGGIYGGVWSLTVGNA